MTLGTQDAAEFEPCPPAAARRGQPELPLRAMSLQSMDLNAKLEHAGAPEIQSLQPDLLAGRAVFNKNLYDMESALRKRTIFNTWFSSNLKYAFQQDSVRKGDYQYWKASYAVKAGEPNDLGQLKAKPRGCIPFSLVMRLRRDKPFIRGSRAGGCFRGSILWRAGRWRPLSTSGIPPF